MTQLVDHPEHGDPRFNVALYTIVEAARALGVPPSTLKNWARGYVRCPPGRPPVKGAPVVTAFETGSGMPAVPFVGLAEGMVLAAARRAHVPLQRIRPALEILAGRIGVEHALASKALLTDGAELLFDYAQRGSGEGVDAARDLVVVRSGQRVFLPVIVDYLRRIDYGPDGYARLIHLPAYERASVVADPTRSFGQPIFVRVGARVIDVLDRFWAGEDIHVLSDEFGASAADIEDVLRAASRRAA